MRVRAKRGASEQHLLTNLKVKLTKGNIAQWILLLIPSVSPGLQPWKYWLFVWGAASWIPCMKCQPAPKGGDGGGLGTPPPAGPGFLQHLEGFEDIHQCYPWVKSLPRMAFPDPGLSKLGMTSSQISLWCCFWSEKLSSDS